MALLRSRAPALVLVTVAIALAGCGGSSKKSSGTSTGGTGTSATAVLPPSTKVTSALYRAFGERGLSAIPGVPHAAIPKIINCVIQKELSQGLTTVGAVKANKPEVRTDGIDCARAAGLH